MTPFPLEQYNSDGDRRLLLKGGTIISMDPHVGNFASGDILIEGTRIAAIGAEISAEAPVIDARRMIVIPGFCDPHIHCWQGNLPRIIGNQLGDHSNKTSPSEALAAQNYHFVMHQTFSHLYRPEDIYAGTLMSLVAAMNGGITTICDNAHNTRSPEHSDASIRALTDSGVRGIHAYGRAKLGVRDDAYPSDIYRLKRDHFSSEDQLLTLRLWVHGNETPERFEKVLEVRKEMDCWISIDSGAGSKPLRELYASGKLDGRESFNHGNGLTLEQMKAVASHGATVNVCPRIESQFRFGDIPYQAWRNIGLKPAMSNDDPATYALNMFQEMRTLYSHQRAAILRKHTSGEGGLENLVTQAEVLEAATLRGAACCGLLDKVGSLTPGKQADIILLDTDNVQLFPRHNVFCTVVQGGDVEFVDSVFIAGKLVKYGGQLVAVDFERLKRLVEQSRDYLFETARWIRPKVDFGD
jgi:cytosine/adenosine deaminase-related metal-dependent hydrolase